MKLFRNVLLLSLLLVFFACNQDKVTPVEGDVAALTADEVKKLNDFGFAKEDITSINEERIIVQEDMLIYREKLRNLEYVSHPAFSPVEYDPDHLEERQLIVSTSNAVGIGDFTLLYFIDVTGANGFNTAMADLIRDGFDAWTAVTNCQNFSETTNQASADIVVTNVNLGENFWGQAEVANNSDAGSTLELNAAELTEDFNNADIVNVVAHEIGHNLGFRHADLNSGSNFVFLHGTTANDLTSLMTSGGGQNVPPGPVNGFNNADIRAARMAYPLFDHPVQNMYVTLGQQINPYVREFTVYWAMRFDAPYYDVEVCQTLLGSGGQELETLCFYQLSNTSQMELGGYINGTYRIDVTPRNYKRDFEGQTVSQTINL